MAKIRLEFSAGTLLVKPEEGTELPEPIASSTIQDIRVNSYRAAASDYEKIMRTAYENRLEIEDAARSYNSLDLKIFNPHPPMPHQRKALEKWLRQNLFRGSGDCRDPALDSGRRADHRPHDPVAESAEFLFPM